MNAYTAKTAITAVFDFLSIDELNSRWLLIRDEQTIYFLAARDVEQGPLDEAREAEEALEALDEKWANGEIDASDEWSEVEYLRAKERANDNYSVWCGQTVGRRDHEVPVRVLRAARQLLDREPGEGVCQGW